MSDAMRVNEGKGEHDYILTYPSGIHAIFPPTFWLADTFHELSSWYRGHTDTLSIISVLREECRNAYEDLAGALAETQTHGAEKYEIGNYLRGGNWRQYCQSAIRHGTAILAEETHDSEGNNHLGAIAFNLLALDMCVTLGLGRDDRIKKPESPAPPCPVASCEPQPNTYPYQEAEPSCEPDTFRMQKPEPRSICEHVWVPNSVNGWNCTQCSAGIYVLNTEPRYERLDLPNKPRFSTYWQAVRAS